MRERYGDSSESKINTQYEGFFSNIEAKLTESIKGMGGDRFRWEPPTNMEGTYPIAHKRRSQSFSFMKGGTAHIIEVNAQTNTILLVKPNFDGPADKEVITLENLAAKFRSSR